MKNKSIDRKRALNKFIAVLLSASIILLYELAVISTIKHIGFGGLKMLLGLIGVLSALFVVNILETAVHEAGHLFFGLLSGYKFLEYRIFSLALSKTDKGLRLHRKTVYGTIGQCLLAPPEYEKGKFQFRMYILGGGLFNIIYAVILFLLSRAVGTGIAWSVLFYASLLSLAIGIMNLIPLNYILGNDGYDYMGLVRDERERYFFYLSLKYMAFTMGKCESPIDEIEKIDNSELFSRLSSKSAVTMLCVKISRLMSKNEMEKASELIDNIISKSELMEFYRNNLCTERLFLELIGDKNEEKINKLYDKELKKYIDRTHKGSIGSTRVRYAYLMYKGDTLLAGKEKEIFERLADRYPSKTDADEERRLFALVEN